MASTERFHSESPTGLGADQKLVGLAILSVLVVLICVANGALDVSMGNLLAILTSWSGEGVDATEHAVVMSIRLPRVLMAALVGGSLAVAGAALQGIFRNPLADPGLIGVSSGAAVGVVCWIVFGSVVASAWPAMEFLQSQWVTPFAAFAGGLAATALVVRLSRRDGRIDVTTMLLAGIAVNAFAGAVIGFAIFASDEEQLRTLTMWTLGSLGGSTWQVLGAVAALSVVPLAWLMRKVDELDLILLGESEAAHLGVSVARLHRGVVAACALVVGASVGFTGMIGFVGLVVPHLLRLVDGPQHRWVMPGSFILGATLLGLADLLSRTVVAPAELPIGIVTALIGAPFFVVLLLRSRMGGGW